jgi:hypothetical protein
MKNCGYVGDSWYFAFIYKEINDVFAHCRSFKSAKKFGRAMAKHPKRLGSQIENLQIATFWCPQICGFVICRIYSIWRSPIFADMKPNKKKVGVLKNIKLATPLSVSNFSTNARKMIEISSETIPLSINNSKRVII